EIRSANEWLGNPTATITCMKTHVYQRRYFIASPCPTILGTPEIGGCADGTHHVSTGAVRHRDKQIKTGGAPLLSVTLGVLAIAPRCRGFRLYKHTLVLWPPKQCG